MTSRTLVLAGAVALVLVLVGCEFTAQHDDTSETSVAGLPGAGAGGINGGTGAGTGDGGNAAAGAGLGIPTLPSALPPTAVGSPSMPQTGSKPNPDASTSSRSAIGARGGETGTAPEGGPPIPGTTQDGSERGGETAGERAQEGVPSANGTPAGNANAPGEPGQAGGEIGTSESEADGSGDDVAASGGEAGDSGDEVGASEGAADESGDESGQSGSGDELGANVAEAGPNVPDIGDGTTATAARRAAIRGRLDASYAAIDRLTLEERERVRRAASSGMSRGLSDANGLENGGGGDGAGERSTAVASNTAGTGGAVMPSGRTARPGEFDDDNTTITYPVPADIPSGDDDDIVARQLREAAVHEADPDLRESLWDEYREYIGI